MSKNKRQRIILAVPGPAFPDNPTKPLCPFGAIGTVRDWLIRHYEPAYPNILCWFVTWAFGFKKGEDIPPYPTTPCEVTVRGIYRDSDCDVLIVHVTELKRSHGNVWIPTDRVHEKTPAGDLLHITFSVRDGFPPGQAKSQVNPERITWITDNTRPFRGSFRIIPSSTDLQTPNPLLTAH